MKSLSLVFRRSDNSITPIRGPFGKVEGVRAQGDAMRKYNRLDFAKLLGFDTVAAKLFEELDFQDQIIAARLGAKIGVEPRAEPQNKVDLRKLFGFASVSAELGDNVDFQADVIEAKLGAKVGTEAWVACEDVAAHESGEGNA